jgi:hypothetical protein
MDDAQMAHRPESSPATDTVSIERAGDAGIK